MAAATIRDPSPDGDATNVTATLDGLAVADETSSSTKVFESDSFRGKRWLAHLDTQGVRDHELKVMHCVFTQFGTPVIDDEATLVVAI